MKFLKYIKFELRIKTLWERKSIISSINSFQIRPRSETLGLELLKNEASYLGSGDFILRSVEDSLLLDYWDSYTSQHYQNTKKATPQ